MPKSPKRADSEPDVNQLAHSIVERATRTVMGAGVHQKNPAAVALGKLGGAKGGLARAGVLSPKQRSAIAKKAAKARWGK